MKGSLAIAPLLVFGSISAAQAAPCSKVRKDAAARVRLCKDVSPATHPPCNAQNDCSLIEDEIARGCGMLDQKDRPRGCKSF